MKTHTHTDGTVYTVLPCNTTTGLLAAGIVSSIAGPAIAMAMRDKGAGVDRAVAAILSAPDLGPNLVQLCRYFASTTMAATPARPPQDLSDPKEFEAHFAGRYDALLGWLAVAIEVNLSSFFVGLSALQAKAEALAAAKKEQASKSPSPPGPSGRSG